MYSSTSSALSHSHMDADCFNNNNKSKTATALLNAIRNDELCVHYQPRYNVSKQRTGIIEALVRWQKPGIGLVHPEGFITDAIEHGLIFAVDVWVFEQCCKDMVWLRKQYDGDLKIAVNITATECESLHHTNQLVKICEAYGLKLSDFEFEITETVNMRNRKMIAAFCKTFASQGASVCLDDFGTGFSPLSNLCNLSINTIKIDKSFIQQMESRNRFRIMVKHLIDIAHEMQLKIVAEGIETTEQFNRLRGMGCHQLQGYHISRPIPVKMMLPFLVTM